MARSMVKFHVSQLFQRRNIVQHAWLQSLPQYPTCRLLHGITLTDLDRSAWRDDEIADGIEFLGYENLVKDLAVMYDCHTRCLQFHKSQRKQHCEFKIKEPVFMLMARSYSLPSPTVPMAFAEPNASVIDCTRTGDQHINLQLLLF